MPTICVPDAATADALADLADRADRAGGESAPRVVTWELGAPPPEGIGEVEFFVPAYAATVTSRADIGRMPHLKVLQVLTAGVEGWLDRVPAGAALCSGRGIHGVGTAELALAGILSHLRRLPEFAAAQGRHVWDRKFTGSLRDRRVLVLGAGDIGQRVAAVASVFDADVTVVGRRSRDGVRALSDLAALLPSAEIVVLALPSTPQTDGLVDADFLAALPDGALVVNVARAALIVTDALLAELQSGRLYAFLDVVRPEPLPPGDELWTAPNLVLTPHIGGGTTGWERSARRLVLDQVERYLSGQPLANLVVAGY